MRRLVRRATVASAPGILGGTLTRRRSSIRIVAPGEEEEEESAVQSAPSIPAHPRMPYRNASLSANPTMADGYRPPASNMF
ncbi:hypothetical protein STCU_11082 [Strigomonas culicis]|uniref:Uncharacterized protein n=1 Tax=Strigomonas culicis TaxID=28005 RepID=S9TJX2_9TRYP|nr:hypothetical protein STCU_11082 [Strigomonas culicis]|eukprot:EPY16643.1 hypothetical protein STCU_11082 [Strigomonas culicis]